MGNSVIYTLKVWLTAAFLSPLLIIIYFSFSHFDPGDSIIVLVFGVVAGLAFSFPGMLILWLISYALRRNGGLTITAQKTVLSAISVGITVLSFTLYDKGFSTGIKFEPVSMTYVGVAIGSIWYYKLYTDGELEAMV